MTSAEQLTALLGEVDPIVIERILALRPSFDDVAEALGTIENADAFKDAPHVPSSPKVAEVRAVLEELVLEPPEDDPVVSTD